MKQIKASEVKPGMVVKWESEGFTHEGTVERVTSGASAYTTRFINGSFSMTVTSDTTVTVLSEPLPEEPKEFGAKVIVDGRQFLRAPLHSSDPTPWLGQLDNIWRDWDYLINMGPVTVVPDLGWTVPDDTPEVPDRIDEWDTWDDVPEGVAVTHQGMRYYYRKVGGEIEAIAPSRGLEWFKFDIPLWSLRGPWTRVDGEWA